MLKCFGLAYLNDLLSAAMAAQDREDGYRVYVTDALAAIARQLGVTINTRFYDIIAPQPQAPADTRPAGEIARAIIEGAGLRARARKEAE